MRRRIALFANGWGMECLQEVGNGLKKVAFANDIDIFAFVNYSAHGDYEFNKLGDFNIFLVPNLQDFDGIVVLTNSFNTGMEMEFVKENIRKSGVPAVSVDTRVEGLDYFGVDDYMGMQEVAEHIIKEHGVKDILYMGGIVGHEGDVARMKAVMDTAKNNGIEIPEDNILHGDFAAVSAVRSLKQWRKSHSLPEAIICANDIMAIGICDYLKEEGISIPGDIKVTGFDCLKVAGEYEPSITSVNRDWSSMGVKIMERLIDKMGGDTAPIDVTISSKMIAGESCGCTLDNNGVNTWKSLRQRFKYKNINEFSIDQHFRHMYLAMRKVATIDDMCNSMSYYYENEGWLEGDSVMLALCPEFFTYVEDDSKLSISKGYPEEMDAAVLLCGGKRYEHHRSKTSNVIFEIANKSGNPGIHIAVPLHNDKEVFGFIMMSGGFEIAHNDILYILTKHMGQYLEQVKSNIAINQLTQRLEALSVTDTLTKVYNRAGCETIIYPKLQECQKNGGRSVVMLADLDCLKEINDMFGHASGDEAIRTTIDLLKKTLPDEYMIGRFGGDEFLIAAPETEETDVDEYAETLMNAVANAPSAKIYPFKISVSIGGVQLNEKERFSIQDCLPKVDEKVYRIKEIHHIEHVKKQRI